MNKAERIALSKAEQHKSLRWKRDYGKTVDVGCRLGELQHAALLALQEREPYAPITEHLRRAVDLYLLDRGVTLVTLFKDGQAK